MTLVDARAIPSGSTLAADVCIVGSGAAGITLARELDGSPLSVVLLEAGSLKRDPDVEAESFAIDYVGLPHRNPIPTRGRWFGGSTNLWFGRIARPDAIDFESRAWVPHSGWPLAYDHIRPWLHTAATILDVPHFDMIDVASWTSNPTIETFAGQGGAALEVFLWANGLFMGPRHRKRLEASRNVRLVLEATATELVPNEGSTLIESLAVCGPWNNRFAVNAAVYVLAAGGFENPRLLLASTRRSPAGVGNGEDAVGRYYMDHPRGEGLAKIDLRGLAASQIQRLTMLGEKSRSAAGKVQFRVTFPTQMQREEELLNHALHAHLVSGFHRSAGYLRARRIRNRLSRKWIEPGSSLAEDVTAAVRSGPELAYLGARTLAGRAYPVELILIDQMEQEPDPSSRIVVDPRRRDRFGLPALVLDWRIAESTYRSQRRMHRLFKGIVERAGIRTFTSEVLDRPDERLDLWDMKHPMGTTRMASSPKEGVVDADCRVHGVENLYVGGSSVFPTGGHANPTLLIVGLAARLARHLRSVALPGLR